MSIAEPAPSSATSDRRLVGAAQAGDGAAFEALLTARLDRTYRTARAILGNEPDARDAVQDAWLSAWRRLPDLRDTQAFDGWIDRIVINACRSRLRDRARVREIPMTAGFETQDRSFGSRPEDVAEREAVEQAFERLNADQRAILVLHHVHHQPVTAIAAALGIPEGTAKWRLHAARTALSSAMENDR
jgi:RNA polymerase sigma-70 factor, ECF subfamily